MIWKQIWETHGGRIVGVLAGIGCGVLYVTVGFWDMLFFALLVFIGYTVGRNRDLRLGPFIPWQRLSEWLGDRWRPFR
ncbi:DUF2273 domain-containing protein [Paenibacillus sp. WLX2291]|uniref:DUF2273 domain-containing protein n=1 Tax=Paenibacillus sp. WLX2291 TaxID=3296934 RepID=UPI0039841E99